MQEPGRARSLSCPSAPSALCALCFLQIHIKYSAHSRLNMRALIFVETYKPLVLYWNMGSDFMCVRYL